MENWKLKPAHDLTLPLQQRLQSVRREVGLIDSITHQAWWSCIHLCLKIFHRLHIEGIHHLPSSGSFVLAANHASHLDALVIAAAVPWRRRNEVFPIAAGDTFFETRITAALSASLLNALPLWRKRAGSHAMTDLRQRLIEEPCIYIVFPEGTRSRTGEMGRFKAGLGMLVAGTQVPVVPCRLFGTHDAFPPDRRRPSMTPIRLHMGAPVSFHATPNDREGWETIATTIESAVVELGRGH